MKKSIKNILLAIFFMALIGCEAQSNRGEVDASLEVLTRIVGEANIRKFNLSIDPLMTDGYAVHVSDNIVKISGSNQVALCRGAYDYLTNACNSIVSWSGNNINIPEKLPLYTNKVESPYKYHYYLNVVTHGYTTPYWNWERWEKEIDWMAMHGMNMPLLSGAHEAILFRVFKKVGFSQKDIDEYFTGPAHFPWNKMGNITGWDGNFPDTFFEKQVQLNHQILDRMKELDMHAIIPAFAGFIPSGVQDLFPDENSRELSWGGFEKQYSAKILEPGSDLFIKIGKMYISEYEKEFGKQAFYLADSFNEMDVPLSEDSTTALNELATYGESVYKSIQEANPDATWVMQGWTFPYQKKDGKLFWTPERLQALVSRVPDDKLLILDLANEYNKLFWEIEPSWKMYSGFFGKQWIYSFIPNMGGKTAYNGRLDMYAKMPFEAMNYTNKGNLVGFGFAPEGIENNEIIYELLSDVGWKTEEINLNDWIERYCTNRYGAFPDKMKKAFEYFNTSCFGSFTDHPRNAYQFRPNTKSKGSINTSDDFGKGVQLFLDSSSDLKDSELYQVDVIEYTCQYLGLKADDLLAEFQETGENNYTLLNEALDILTNIDRLLESHPNWKLQNWTTHARNWGETQEEKAYYEANARRLITTWGGDINEYAAKTWSGLLRDYYIPRWKEYYKAKEESVVFDLLAWEEAWIHSTEISEIEPFDNPIEMAVKLFKEQYSVITDQEQE